MTRNPSNQKTENSNMIQSNISVMNLTPSNVAKLEPGLQIPGVGLFLEKLTTQRNKIAQIISNPSHRFAIHQLGAVFWAVCFWLAVVFVINLYRSNLVGFFGINSSSVLAWVTTAMLILFNSVVLHSHFNALHQASHRQLSKNPAINNLAGNYIAFFCGLTFADFASTHNQHHRHVGNPTKDPDHQISHNMGFGLNFLLVPIKIFYHDKWFLGQKWTEKKDKESQISKDDNKFNIIKLTTLLLTDLELASYFETRILQILVVGTLFALGFGQIWLIFWAIPMFIVGFANGFYLFFLPHYQLPKEKFWLKKMGIVSKFLLFTADLARTSHHQHHQKVSNTLAYYPISAKILEFEQQK